MDKNKPLYLISAVSKMFDIHPQTLRMYEREGLIVPQRTGGNTRRYSQADIERLESILSLTRDMGVNLAGVEIILQQRIKLQKSERRFEELENQLEQNFQDHEQHIRERIYACIRAATESTETDDRE